jgi:hypothetical protein
MSTDCTAIKMSTGCTAIKLDASLPLPLDTKAHKELIVAIGNPRDPASIELLKIIDRKMTNMRNHSSRVRTMKNEHVLKLEAVERAHVLEKEEVRYMISAALERQKVKQEVADAEKEKVKTLTVGDVVTINNNVFKGTIGIIVDYRDDVYVVHSLLLNGGSVHGPKELFTFLPNTPRSEVLMSFSDFYWKFNVPEVCESWKRDNC